jgi:hypothetical protein
MGQVLHRRITPLARRNSVDFCSGAYSVRSDGIILFQLR